MLLTFSTALHHSVQQRNDELFTVLLDRPDLDLECVNNEGHSVLWCALQCDESFTDASYAARLLKRGASPDALVNDTGETGDRCKPFVIGFGWLMILCVCVY